MKYFVYSYKSGRLMGSTWHKLVLCGSLVLMSFQFSFSQEQSRAQTATNGFYYWETNANWTDNSAAPTANIGSPVQNAGGDPQIIIEGYITRNGSLSFANIGTNTKTFIIRDTLVVYGSVTFPANSYSLVMEAGSVLVVFGDFSAGNKVTVDNGGLIIVDGNLSLTGGQNDYIDNNGSSEPNLVVTGTIGGNGDTAAATADNGTLTQQPTAIQQFVNGNGETPLPIVLGNFEATFYKGSVDLEWETLSEQNFDRFEIQHSTDGTVFNVIGVVKGQGSSIEKTRYEFSHKSPNQGINFYRLQAIDFDGTYEIFKTIAVEVIPDFQAVRVFPNPGSGLSVKVELPIAFLEIKDLSINVSDLQGRIIASQQVADYQVEFNFEEKLATGIYLISIQAGTAQSTFRLLVN